MKISNSAVCLDLEIVVYVSKEQFFLHGFEKGLVFKFFFARLLSCVLRVHDMHF